jgi:acetyl esterase/lipase
MFSFMLLVAVSFVATIGARMTGQPLRPGWSFRFEVIARSLKANAARLARLDWPAQRKAQEALVPPSPVLKQLKFERASVGGIAGEWFVPLDASDDAPVLLYFHGGSFIYGSLVTHRELIAREGLASGARVFAPEYRLAPEHPFPAAVEDASAVYRGLLGEGIAPARVVLAGDSAGANLAVVTLLQARDAGIPLPAGAVLTCPWVDLTARSGSLLANARFDWAEPDDFERWVTTYLAGKDPKDPSASPAFADLHGLPPLLVQIGGAEMLFDQVAAFVERAKTQGVDVEYRVHADMVHNWHMLAASFESGRKAIAEIGAFVRRVAARGA